MRVPSTFFLSVMALLIYGQYYSQKEANNWYFGGYAGLVFSGASPTPEFNGQLWSNEGSSSISDKNGTLLFYSNGRTIYDVTHTNMPNGILLAGSTGAGQSCMICPKPGTYNTTLKRYDRYIIATCDYSSGSNGLRFSEIDMTLNNGRGDVISTNKNTHLFGTNMVEGLTFVKHQNGCDYWLIGKQNGSDRWLAYHLSASGVATTPIVSSAGSIITANSGSLKASPNNDLLVLSTHASLGVGVYTFDNATGSVSFKYNHIVNNSYSCEFSPNGKLLYTTALGDSNIAQYDLTTTNQVDFINSRIIIGTTLNNATPDKVGTLQLGPDGRVYLALPGIASLGTIKKPNVRAIGCSYTDGYIDISGINANSAPTVSTLGLSAIPQFLISEPNKITSDLQCEANSYLFTLENNADIVNYQWFITPTGSNYPLVPQSITPSLNYVLTSQGQYSVQCIATYGCSVDTIMNTFELKNITPLNLGPDSICFTGPFAMDPTSTDYSTYLWQDGSTIAAHTLNSSGTYHCTVGSEGPNLIKNGDFELGDNWFSSDYGQYNYAIIPNSYSVIPNANINPAFSNCWDHTSTSSFGNMLIINGEFGPSEVWCQEVTVEPNTDYLFSGWVQTLANTSQLALLDISINGSIIGNSVTPPSNVCVWQEFSSLWNSGTATTANVCIIESGIGSSGKDFALDDLRFTPICYQMDTITVLDRPTVNIGRTNHCLGDTSFFFDNSTSPNGSIIDWRWNFGNGPGDTSKLDNPPYFYSSAGSYIVTLEVTDENNCENLGSTSLTIHPKPDMAFTVNSTCLNDTTIFTNNSSITTGNITNWAWNFGDGSISTIQNSTHLYQGTGNYGVLFSATSAFGCTDTIGRKVTINGRPTAFFSTTSSCHGDSTVIINSSSTFPQTTQTSLWDFGDGQTSVVDQPNHLYGTNGTYNIQLIVTNNHNCVDSVSQEIRIFPVPSANFLAPSQCLTDTTFITNSSSYSGQGTPSYSWDFGDGNSSTATNPFNLYAIDGNYTIKLIVVSDSGCRDTLTKPIDLFAVPNSNFTFSSACDGDTINFTDFSSINSTSSIINWEYNFNDGSMPNTDPNPNHLFSGYGSYGVVLTTTSSDGCTDDTVMNVWVNPLPNADFISVDSICQNGPPIRFMNFSSIANGTINSWDWTFGDSNSSTLENPSHSYSQYGNYNVTLMVISDSGCSDDFSKSLSIKPSPNVVFEADKQSGCSAICVNFSSLSATPMGSIINHHWDFGNGQMGADPDDSICYENLDYNFSAVHNVQLIVENSFHCFDTLLQSNFIELFPEPIADFESETLTSILDPEITFTNLSRGAVSANNWSFGDAYFSNDSDPIHSYSDSGTYLVQLIVDNSYSCSDTAYSEITIYPENLFYIPNSFTPNGDGFNDFFFPVLYGVQKRDYSFYVYNKWGELIFYSNSPGTSWDGKHNGQWVPNGSYIYTINYRDLTTISREVSGTINLIR